MFTKRKIKGGFVINSTLKAWQKIKSILQTEIGLPGTVGLWNNSAITIQNKKLNWSSWKEKGILTLSDICGDGKILSFIQLKQKMYVTNNDFFKYSQLRSWLQDTFLSQGSIESPAVKWILKTGEKRKLIGTTYNGLIDQLADRYSLDKVYQNWNNDLKTTDSNVKRKECLHVTNSITTNENLRLIQYKLITNILY